MDVLSRIWGFFAPRADLAGRAVFVSGCDSGLGAALVAQLATQGARVFAACLTDEGAQRLAGLANVAPLRLDVTDPAQIADAVRTVERLLDGEPLHGLVLNAGVARSFLLEWSSPSDIAAEHAVNFQEGVVSMVHSFLPLLRSSGHRSRDSRSPPPRIVCISSISALYPIATFSGYSSSKAAVRAFCKAIAIELDWHNIRVSCVIPGAHKSPMTEQLDVRPARAWERLDPRTKAAYGEKFYASLLEQLENTRRFSVLPPISSAAERTADVLARWTPPGEVFVGWDCYLFWILEWLPWRWQVAAGRAFAGMVETPAFLLPAGTSQDRENKSE